MINNKLAAYIANHPYRDLDELKLILKEMLQKIILSGLSRSGFFDYALFYGGTSLRILRNLDRFSEDLDFVIYNDKFNFDNLDKYLKFVNKELLSFGIDNQITIKEKVTDTSVVTTYIKINLLSLISLCDVEKKYNINKEELISIKLDFENNFIKGGNIEYKTILFPNQAKVLTYQMDTLFACKITALLNRNWKNRVKGRDYYDYLFFMNNDIKPNYLYLSNSINEGKEISKEELINRLKDKFNSVDFAMINNDVAPFIQDKETPLTKEVFIDSLEYLR